jgi:chorismate mutase
VIKERRERQAEKKRMEEMAAKMSAKKLQRMRKVCRENLLDFRGMVKLTMVAARPVCQDQRLIAPASLIRLRQSWHFYIMLYMHRLRETAGLDTDCSGVVDVAPLRDPIS